MDYCKSTKSKRKIYVTGIDLSSAFDTINREKLIEIMKEIIGEDELIMIKILLSNTSLQIKMNNVNAEPFETNVGSPQGDGLSGDLFNIYFEHSLRKLRAKLDEQCPKIPSIFEHQTPPDETIYADDADFITTDKIRRDKLNEIFIDILSQDNLKSNATKTEHTVIERGDNETEMWRKVQKLGSLLGDKEDINRRKQLSIASMNDYEKLWLKRNHINEKLRIDLYNTFIKPILLYNCATWGVSKNDEEKLDAFHRKQLRRVIGKKYPDKISNLNLYKRCNSSPISLEIINYRWQKFGHILRLNKEVPAYQAMLYYFEYSDLPFFRGGRRITIVTTLNDDLELLKKYNENLICVYPFLRRYSQSLVSKRDIELFRQIAMNRNEWNILKGHVCRAAKANKSFF